MERMKVHFSRMIITCTALMILNSVVPERLYILPACCIAQGSSCCNKTASKTNPIILNRACCEVEVIELRQALSAQVAVQRNCPEFFPLDTCGSAHHVHLTGNVQSSRCPMNFKDYLLILRSNEKYPEPRIQI